VQSTKSPPKSLQNELEDVENATQTLGITTTHFSASFSKRAPQ